MLPFRIICNLIMEFSFQGVKLTIYVDVRFPCMTSGNKRQFSQKCYYLFLTAEQAGNIGIVISQTQRQNLLVSEWSFCFRQ